MWQIWFLGLNMNTNIFGLTFFGKYEYKYIWVNIFITKRNIFESHFWEEYECKYIWITKTGQIRIQIWIFGLMFTNMNTNTNSYHAINLNKYKYMFKSLYLLVFGKWKIQNSKCHIFGLVLFWNIQIWINLVPKS